MTKLKFMVAIGILSGMLTSHQNFAQDFRSAIEDIRNSFHHIDEMYVVLNIQVFENAESDTPYFTEHADIKRSKNNYRYLMSGYEMLLNEKYLIIANKNTREIMFSSRDLRSEKAVKDQFDFGMDSIFNMLGDPVLLGKNGKVEHYQLTRSQGSIRKIDFYLNRDKKEIDKIVYTYEEKQVAVIDFVMFDKEPEFSPEVFDEKNYLVFGEGGVTKAISFRDFKIIEN